MTQPTTSPQRDNGRARRLGIRIGIGIVLVWAILTILATAAGGTSDGGDLPNQSAHLGATESALVSPTPSASPASALPTKALPSSPVASPTPSPSDAPKVVALYPVESVTDGDTIRVTVDGVSEPIRIIGLDSPESRKPGTPVECMAREATAAAKRLIQPGSEVALEEDPTQDTRDRYGRLLAHVFLPDGRLFSEEMIRGGYAVHYIYDGVPSVYAERLAAAQDEAEAEGRGLWSPDTCAGDPHGPSARP